MEPLRSKAKKKNPKKAKEGRKGINKNKDR